MGNHSISLNANVEDKLLKIKKKMRQNSLSNTISILIEDYQL